eukprot:TRINITY_DN58075_c1_g1_i1.p2 TRINITY_DN58075_c1_g1~~TRINITY_DN58075_c1_g1_i1.p2  ORF type:complete len:405 (-),score=214.75 TRINITY_DN58075_c1_g1_i1:69-1226(-)
MDDAEEVKRRESAIDDAIAAAEAAVKSSASFPQLSNDTLLRAARGQPSKHVPVWLHRQAGRYLPEFRAERLKADFFTICRTPALACRVTLQPLERFELDAAIIFSDILVVPQAMGLEVQMVKGKGPVLPAPVRAPEDMKRLETAPDIGKTLGYVFDAITLTRHALGGRVPLIGFTGAPWTLMCYMVEGQGAKSYYSAKKWLYKHPKEAHALLQSITDVCVEYLIGQVAAGAQMLEVFDSWAGDLSPQMFAEFGLKYLKQIAARVKQALRERDDLEVVPMTVFPKGAHHSLEALADTEYDVISLDWTMDPQVARKRVNGRVALQGNLEPAALYADEQRLRHEVKQMLDGFGTRGYIANLGHGMLPSHDPAAVATVVDAVHRYSNSD